MGSPDSEEDVVARRGGPAPAPRKPLRFADLVPPHRQDIAVAPPPACFLDEHPGKFREYRNVKKSTSSTSVPEFRNRCPEYTVDENRGPWHALTAHTGVQRNSNRQPTPFYRAKLLRGVAYGSNLGGDVRGARSRSARETRRGRRYLPAGPDFYQSGLGCQQKEGLFFSVPRRGGGVLEEDADLHTTVSGGGGGAAGGGFPWSSTRQRRRPQSASAAATVSGTTSALREAGGDHPIPNGHHRVDVDDYHWEVFCDLLKEREKLRARDLAIGDTVKNKARRDQRRSVEKWRGKLWELEGCLRRAKGGSSSNAVKVNTQLTEMRTPSKSIHSELARAGRGLW